MNLFSFARVVTAAAMIFALGLPATAQVTSFNTRTGAVTLLQSDINSALGFTPVQSLPGTNYTIAPSGGNYTSVRAAFSALTAFNVVPSANIALNVAAGTYTDTVPLTVQSRFGNILSITGAGTIAHNLTSIVGATGSAGAWSLTLQLDSVAGMTAAQDYITIANASGGTNPTYMNGVFPVTAVNSGTNQITVTSLSRASSAPGGAVTAAITDIPTVLKWTGVTGVQVYGQSALVIDKVVISCDNSANQFGLDEEDVSRVFVPTILAFYNCGAGVVVNYNSQLNASGNVFASGGTNPVFAWGGGQVQIVSGGSLIATGGTGSASGSNANVLVTHRGYVNVGAAGVASGGAANGMLAQSGGFIYATNSLATGNAGRGYNAYNYGTVYNNGGTDTGNGVASSVPFDITSSQIDFAQQFILGYPDGDPTSFCAGLNACANQTNSSSGQNTEFGVQAGQFVSSGVGTTAFGESSCRGASATPLTGNQNGCFGNNAGAMLRGTAAQNSLFGSFSGANATSAGGTAAFGFESCEALTTGTNNMCLGYKVGSTTLSTGSRNILIGTNNNCDAATSAKNDTFALCASSGSTPLLSGNLASGSQALAIDGAAVEGVGTLNIPGAYYNNGTAGVTSTTCTQWTGGICTHP
ncbi:MAG TPA: hypothetical protein VHU23_02020 [Rhizomicrobium sp.]|jgi:hypothetical protein|nr:hypothetical protein [Rhizomicrobium sp.]